jgi:hypothetical protein
MNLRPQWSRVALAFLIGVALTAAASVLQPHFKAGSIPDLACELILLPGELVASLFQDRGNASPEFLWRSRIATAILLSGLIWCCLAIRKRRAESLTAPRQ